MTGMNDEEHMFSLQASGTAKVLACILVRSGAKGTSHTLTTIVPRFYELGTGILVHPFDN